MTTAILWLSATAAIGLAAAWSALARLSLDRSKDSRLLTPSEEPIGPDAPPIAVVVPARNEAGRIIRTLESLTAQTYPNLSITVVDDQSTDGTAEAVENWIHARGLPTPEVRLIRGVERPSGWVGKTWAIHQGIQTNSLTWIGIIDADMDLHPSALATAWAEAERTGADFVSLLGRPICRTFWQAAVASAIIQILGLLYPLRRVNDPDRPEALAHGAFMLCRRALYDRVGGIAAVRHEVVEDIRLATLVKEAGGRLAVLPAPDLSKTHMYGSLREIARGLRKNAYAGMDFQPHKFATGALLSLSMIWGPPILTGFGLAGLAFGAPVARGWPAAWLGLGLLAWFFQALFAAPAIVFLRIPWAYAFATPLGLTAYTVVTALSVWDYHRGAVLWKDRAFDAATVAPGRTASSVPRSADPRR